MSLKTLIKNHFPVCGKRTINLYYLSELCEEQIGIYIVYVYGLCQTVIGASCHQFSAKKAHVFAGHNLEMCL